MNRSTRERDQRVLHATDPAELTAALVAVPSVSGSEERIADLVEQRLRRRAPALEVHRIGNNVVARSGSGRAPRPWRIVLAGHLDTVPAADPPQPARLTAEHVTGLGAVDMKGGLALMLLLAESAADSPCDTSFVFYDQEEVGSHRSGMHRLFADHRDLVDGDLAVLLEPTGGAVEAGCQGNLVVELDYLGARAHTARPWRGVNAIHRAAPALSRLAAAAPAPVELDGLSYRQSLSVVGFDAGVQGNVVPDRASIRVNYRHAPTIDSETAVGIVTALVPEPDRVSVRLASPSARPELGHPLLAAWRERTAPEVRPKLGWTDVGRFAAHGIPALNFGPGDPELAHTPDESVDRAELVRCHRALHDLLHARPPAPVTKGAPAHYAAVH
ncbi:succinyl-diaminopimelate desuccinylase [Kitasatospora cineracea]|uniref:succinyl-diaminopimelate desuccinylase n=1 Tax=Kitasatospora cineracea TaxID=88074 RepID=UPI0038144D37